MLKKRSKKSGVADGGVILPFRESGEEIVENVRELIAARQA